MPSRFGDLTNPFQLQCGEGGRAKLVHACRHHVLTVEERVGEGRHSEQQHHSELVVPVAPVRQPKDDCALGVVGKPSLVRNEGRGRQQQ